MQSKLKYKAADRCLVLGMLFVGVFLCPLMARAQQNAEMPNTAVPLAESVEREVEVNARKRVQWVNEKNGDAKITLQYASDSGKLMVTQDMNVVLLHDKSGSMDVNFGYHLLKEENGIKEAEASVPYPVLNDMQWSETIVTTDSDLDIESEGAEQYLERLNCPNEYTKRIGASDGIIKKNNKTQFHEYYSMFNAACQIDGHYYFLIKDDPRSGIAAWRMVQGKNLYNIQNTDLHHYILIQAKDGKSSRDCAVELIEQGRRVVRMTTDSEYYYTENGETKITENLYFLDVSTLENYNGKWILNSCGTKECTEHGRLKKTQQFMTALTDNILNLNPSNKIAYIPFWGGVPENGTWKNYIGNASGNDIIDISDYEYLLTSCEGVDALDFTSDAVSLKNQMNHSFTYNGTNWSKAFEKAIEYLDRRSEADKEKETLVLFLTDGMPQGTEGTDLDFQNPYISGIKTDSSGKICGGTAYQLQNIQGVTVWSVGIGINELDTTGLKNRLKLINEDGVPFFARYSADFDSLREDVFEKIEKTYVENFYATDAFFKDTLSEYFIPDREKMDASWKIITEKPSEVKVHGVPENVYEAIQKNGEHTGISKVYEESTKTIYWYLGTLSNGSYEDDGHSLDIPVKFLAYGEDTGGANRIIAGNLEQSLTYHTTLKPDKLYTVSIDTPKLIFFRKNAEIVVTKEVSNIVTSDRTYHYVYSKEKYTSGKIKNVQGRFQITIPGGKTSGTKTLKNVDEGTYYIYETDKNNVMINPQIGVAAVSYRPIISTKAKSSQIPWSVTTTDSVNLKNENNYLEISAGDSVTFNRGAVLTVSKQIDAGEGEIHWEHGNPTFMIKLSGTGSDGKEYVFCNAFEFTKEFVEENTVNGKVMMSHTFYDIPPGEKYTLEEVRVSRYELKEIVSSDLSGDASVRLINTTDSTDGFSELKAEIDLQKKPQGVSLILYNQKVNEQWFSHITSVKNVINTLEK